MARKGAAVRRSPKKSPAKKPEPRDEVLTKLAREIVDTLERTELRRWEGWMDQDNQLMH